MDNELQLRTGAYKTTFVGTEIIRESTPEEWQNYGEILKRVDEAKQWAIGDWLVDGKKHYGDGLYKRASEITGLEERYLQNLKQIADKYQITHRCVKLSWRHHSEAASIKQTEEIYNKDGEPTGKLKISDKPDMEKIQEFLKTAEKLDLSVKGLREKVKGYKEEQQEYIRLINEPEKYSIIYADPPWQYDFSETTNREIENHYSTLSLDEIKKHIPPAAENCILFLWATAPKLKEALFVMEAWGFEYKTNAVWDKEKIGMGYWFRGQHEYVMVGVKGKMSPPEPELRHSSVFRETRNEHSKKPLCVYEWIEKAFPGLSKLEMYARSARDGWTAWGNEL